MDDAERSDDSGEFEVEPSLLHRTWVRVALGLLVLVSVFVMACPSYKIPSGSMMPGLHAGDHILVNRLAYGMFGGEIERGELVVFRYPLDERQLFFKRIIGLPGDEVRVSGPQVSIRRPGADRFEDLPVDPIDRTCVGMNGRPISRCTLYREIADGRSYEVRYKHRKPGHEDPEETWTVPEGHLFVLGDNRNDSLDSRRWELDVGEEIQPRPFLPIANVTGKAVRIWWPLSRSGALR